MELITLIETALSASKREESHFLTYLLAMALTEAKDLTEEQPLNDNHPDPRHGKPK